MIVENIQYWLCTEVILQQSMITSFHYRCIPLFTESWNAVREGLSAPNATGPDHLWLQVLQTRDRLRGLGGCCTSAVAKVAALRWLLSCVQYSSDVAWAAESKLKTGADVL
jgi:hypothetical protein